MKIQALAVTTLVAAVSAEGTRKKTFSRALSGSGSSDTCGCEITYNKVVFYCDFDFAVFEPINQDCHGRRNLGEDQQGGGAETITQRELGTPNGFDFLTWVDAVKATQPGCALAPVRSREQLEYYQTLTCDGSGCETLVGVIREDPLEAFKVCDAVASTDDDDCYDGWVNTIDGSSVPDYPDTDSRTVWNDQPERDETVANLASSTSPELYPHGMFDTSYAYPYAILECCLETNCYAEEIVI
jgi:hypothetical protein